MRTLGMRICLFRLFCLAAVCAFVGGICFAQTMPAPDPFGVWQITCSGSSDTIVSIPFIRPPVLAGTISSVSGTWNNIIAVSGSNDWTANQFGYTYPQSPTHYALIGGRFDVLNGTVSTTAGSAVITGTNTSFSTAVSIGDRLMIGRCYFLVKSVTSDTSLTVSVPALATSSGLPASVSKTPKEGCLYTVTSNDLTSLTLDLNGDDLSSVQPDTEILIIPYWTLNSIFPASDANTSFVPSNSPLVRQTQVLVPNYSGLGINRAGATTYFFYNGAWRQFGRPITEDHGNDILLPDAYFIVRNPTKTTTLSVAGDVLTKKLMTSLTTQATSPQDNLVSMIRPIGVTLNDMGLTEGGAFAPSSSAVIRLDQLFLYSNSQIGFNKGASATYFYYNSGWRLFGKPISEDHGNDIIPVGSGFIIRKAATPNGVTQFWGNFPNYVNP
jgi:uncharacterized protein (TIGR02597 family)